MGFLSDTRASLLAVATQKFAENGYHGASTAMIAGAIGMTKQAVLHHFQSKQNLYAEVVEAAVQGLEPALVQGASLRETFARLFQIGQRNPQAFSLIARELMRGDDKSPAVSEPVDRFFAALIELAHQERADLGLAEVQARVFAVFGAISQYAVAGSAIRRVVGDKSYAQSVMVMPDVISALIDSQFRRPFRDG